MEVEEEGDEDLEDDGETVSLREEGIIPTSSPLGKSKRLVLPRGVCTNYLDCFIDFLVPRVIARKMRDCFRIQGGYSLQ